MISLFLFILGISIGSFLNVLIDRLPRGLSVRKGRSHCDFCKHTLVWYDLIPVVSFFLLEGKCRYCSKKLSYQYPLIELITGLLFLFVGLLYSSSPFDLIYWLIILSSLLVIFVADVKYRIIPDEMLIVLLITEFVKQLVTGRNTMLSNTVPAAVVLGIFFFLLVIITKGKGMGMGDVKYAFFMGLFLGIKKTVVAFYIAFLTGALISLILMVGGKKKLKSTIAFGPFLVGATLIASWWGDRLWRLFIRIIGV